MNWTCPKCDGWLVGPTNRLHNCPGLSGLAVYFIPEGTNAKLEIIERGDYLGGENASRVMSVVTTRDDGQDCIVYAPTASGRGEAT